MVQSISQPRCLCVPLAGLGHQVSVIWRQQLHAVDHSKLHRNLDLASLRSALEGVNRDAEAPNRREEGELGAGGILLVLGHCHMDASPRQREDRISLEGKY